MTALLLRGDARRIPLGDETVDLIVTSPPYFKLRSYEDGGEHMDGQVGDEPTPTEFLEALWAITAECWRVLKPTGSLFLNLGDKYAGTGGGNGQTGLSAKSTLSGNGHQGGGPKIRKTPRGANVDRYTMPRNNTKATSGFVRDKSLMNLPARYAIGCTDGMAAPCIDPTHRHHGEWWEPYGPLTPCTSGRWIQRQEIIWSKPNGMPESVKDRGRRSHEQWFHLTKAERYYHDHPAILKVGGNRLHPENGATFGGTKAVGATGLVDSSGRRTGTNTYGEKVRPQTRRALQLAAEHGLTDAHREALKARGLGDNTKSAITRNGTGKNDPEILRLAEEAERALGSYAREFTLSEPSKGKLPGTVWPLPEDETWLPSCVAEMLTHDDDSDTCWTIATQPLKLPDHLKVDHFAAFPMEWPRRLILGWCPPDGLVLDPFGGTGTAALVADALGRTGITMDLSGDYLRLAAWRTTDPKQMARARGDKPPPAPRPANDLPTLFDEATA